MTRKPIYSLKLGKMSVEVFETKVEKNKKVQVIPKIRVIKNYIDKEKKNQETSFLNTEDLPKAIAGLLDAFYYLNKKKATN